MLTPGSVLAGGVIGAVVVFFVVGVLLGGLFSLVLGIMAAAGILVLSGAVAWAVGHPPRV